MSLADPAQFIATLGGLPMTDMNFNASLLLALTAEKRRRLSGADVTLDQCLDPEWATALYQRLATKAANIPRTVPLTATEDRQISEGIERVVTIYPEWKVFFEVPLRFLMMPSTDGLEPDAKVSLTNCLIPQQIYLADGALKNERTIEETIVHEVSHVWMGFFCELGPIQTANAQGTLVLPSGTPNKDPRGVLIAGMFATTIVLYFRRKQAVKNIDLVERIALFTAYQRGCVAVLEATENLGPLGKEINNVMKTLLPTA